MKKRLARAEDGAVTPADAAVDATTAELLLLQHTVGAIDREQLALARSLLVERIGAIQRAQATHMRLPQINATAADDVTADDDTPGASTHER